MVYNPCGTKAQPQAIRLWLKRLCALTMHAGRVAYEISSEKVKRRV
jgi:hypothetical protein